MTSFAMPRTWVRSPSVALRRDHAQRSAEVLVALVARADEAALTLWRSAESYDSGRGKAATWILTLVHRRAVDLVRREERRRTEPLDGVPGSIDRPATDAAWLRREAIDLASYGGFAQSELAEEAERT